MKFELKTFNRNVPDEDLLNDLRQVAKETVLEAGIKLSSKLDLRLRNIRILVLKHYMKTLKRFG